MNYKKDSQKILQLGQQITNIYFSSLRFKLKNDCVCRLITEVFKEASFASILLYDSKKDGLSNYGHYMSPSQFYSIEGDDKEDVEFMLSNISLYEYFIHKYETNTIETSSLEDFISYPFLRSKYILYERKRKPIDEVTFNTFKKEFFDNSSMQEHYNLCMRYKEAIWDKDFYNLDNTDAPSAQYYNNIIRNGVSKKERKYKFLDSYKIDANRKSLVKLYEELLKIKIKGNSIYLAIPLFANKRCLGLIRVLWYSNNLEKNHASVRGLRQWLKEHGQEELQNLAEIIAQHIGNSHPKHEFRQIPYKLLSSFKNSVENEETHEVPNVFDQFCETLRSTINCRACIIRTAENYNSLPIVQGWTTTLDHYVENLKGNDHLIKNIDLLNSLFYQVDNSPENQDQITGGHSKDNRVITLIGVQFTIARTYVEDIKLLYFTETEILNSTKELNEIDPDASKKIFKIFNSEVYDRLLDLNISQVVIIKIPHLNNGYVTLANTIYRPFVDNDIDIVYPHISRWGSEMRIVEKNNEDKRNLVLAKKAELLGKIYHDIEEPLKVLKDRLVQMNEELTDEINKDNIDYFRVVRDYIKAHRKTLPSQGLGIIDFIEGLLSEYKLSNEVEISKSNKPEQTPYSLNDFLSNLINIIREWAYQRRQLGVIKDFRKEDVFVSQNKNLLLLVFWSLILNAIKYSFNANEQITIINEFNPNYQFKGEGHIFVQTFDNNTQYGFSITNWGDIIPPANKDDIFMPGYRCIGNIKEGQGMGLFYTKQRVNAMNGSIDVEVNEHKTTFTILWKKVNTSSS